MRAGTMRERLTFQKKTQSRNAFNEYVDSWTNHVTVWGSVKPLAGRKYYEAKQASSDVTGEIRIRYRSDILPTMKITHGDKTYLIESLVNIEERNRELLIYYKEALD